MMMIIIKIAIVATCVLMLAVILWGFTMYDEWEIGIEFLPKNYNNFELGVSNRNYVTNDNVIEQELRIGLLLFSFIFLFRKL